MKSFDAPFGAEVVNVDAAQKFAAVTVRALKDAINRNLVIVLRDQRLSADDLVVWDNCATQHKSTFDYALPQRRLLYRTTVEGGVPY